MFPHMMGHPSSIRPSAGPLGYPSMDPYRDPYRLDLLGRDPLREARERELTRLNPLGSLMSSELERARALGLAGYPSMHAGFPGGFPATSLASSLLGPGAYAQKMVPPPMGSMYASNAGVHPGAGLGLGHHLPPHMTAPINGAHGHSPQFNGKDPLGR